MKLAWPVIGILCVVALAGCGGGTESAANRGAELLELDSGVCVESDSGYRCDFHDASNRVVLADCFVDQIPVLEARVNAITGCRLVPSRDLSPQRWDDVVRWFRAHGLDPALGFLGEQADPRPGLRGLVASLDEISEGGTSYLVHLYDSESAARQARTPSALALVLGLDLADVKSGSVLQNGRVVAWVSRDFRMADRVHRAVETLAFPGL